MPALQDPGRLATLRYLDLLEPTMEVAFDRLARLAACSLDVPVALVSFVSDDRQVLRGAIGLPEPYATRRETPLSHSFCQHVVMSEEPLIIEDAREHPLVRDNLAIPDLGVVAYAGIPLRTKEGQILGSFCAIDTAPHAWTAAEIAMLTDFAAAALSEIELRATARANDRARYEWLALLDSSGEGIFGLDPDGRCTFINPAALAFFGYRIEECLGHDMHELVHSRRPDGSPYPIEESLISQALRTGVAIHLREKVFWHKSGRPLAVLCSCAPVLNNGIVVGGVVTIVDIGERKRSEEWQALLSEAGATIAVSLDQAMTLESLIHLLVPRVADWCTLDLTDDNNNLTRAAFAHADPAKELLLRELGERYPPASGLPSPLLTALRGGRARLNGRISASERAALTRDPAHLQLVEAIGLDSALVVPLQARGRMLGVLSLVRVAPRDFNAADLEAAEELTRRCALALDNARLYQQAQEAVRLRDQFVAIASHELRTPVTSIRGYAQLLERQAAKGTLDPERARRHAGQIVSQSAQLSALISDLLDASRFQQGRLNLNPEECDLAALAATVLAAFRGAPERTPNHTLRLDAPAPVIGHWDRARLDQVLTNLISNALKYSPEGGEVRVEVGAAVGNQARLVVHDQGLGILPAEQAQLFQPFARGASSQGHIGGTGLGLYIVRQIVEGHGGAVTVTSAPGGGSAFAVTLPLAPPLG